MADDLALLRRKVDTLLSEHKAAIQTVKQEKRRLTEAEEHLAACEQAQQIVQTIAQQVQQKAHRQIVSVVNRCLQVVFGDEAYTFDIAFERKRGRTEAKMSFIRGGVVLEDPVEEAGVGVIEVVSFALRLAALLLARPVRRRLLVLDEPLKSLHSPIYRERMRDLLLSLAKDFETQIIMVTGIDEYRIGKVIELS